MSTPCFQMWTLFLLFGVYQHANGAISSRCTHSIQCGMGAFCQENICRKDGCTADSQCQVGETCIYGSVEGRLKPACFPIKGEFKTTDDFCPGGGAVVIGRDGRVVTCDVTKKCGSGQVCNPLKGLCCTKIRTCPKPSKVAVSWDGSPIMCQIGSVIECPNNYYCEKTGFCCSQKTNVIEPPRPEEKPFVGQTCALSTGCSGGASCNCNGFGCKCECPTELGYSVSSDGRSCQRMRRRLKEKCKSDMECSAAFSECATGGCRCKKGFQRDGDGGCKPINYKCPGNSSPIMKNDKPVLCHRRAVFSRLKINITTLGFKELMINGTMKDGARKELGTCPEDHYCVALFDDATRPGFYQGFCCPTPTDLHPVCPVGEAHESSYYPDFGCTSCPVDYYCHSDGVVTEKSICCPKPCTSMDDIYHNGQCYSTAFYGDSCVINTQCASKPSFGTDDTEQAPLECKRGVCTCPGGYSHLNGQCKRIACTVGLRGEPSVDRNNELLTCSRTSDCSQGQLCDITHKVCCKGINRCPTGFEETGEQCSNGMQCSNSGHLCHLANEYKKTRICCVSV